MNTNSKIKEHSTSFRASAIEWRGTRYYQCIFPDLLKFICYWMGYFPNDHFYMTVEGKVFLVTLSYEAGNYIAKVPKFVDMSDPVFMCASRNSREEALSGLAEQISERLLAEQLI